MTQRVFVYGTLQEGEANHHRLISRYVASATAASTRGWLFDLGAYPAAVQGCGVIHGQLLEFHDEQAAAAAFAAMDVLEGVNPEEPESGLYVRVETTAVTAGGEEISCFIYRMPEPGKIRLESSADLLPEGVWPRTKAAVAHEPHALYVAYGSCMSAESLAEQIAEGMLFRIPLSQLPSLDAREGAPYAYHRTLVTFECDGLTLPAMTYEVRNKLDAELAPHPSYVKLIMDGAGQLSPAYVDRLLSHIRHLQENTSKGDV